MYLAQKNQLRGLPKQACKILFQLNPSVQEPHNQTYFTVRQYYFATGSYLPYEQAYHLLKDDKNYRMSPRKSPSRQ